MECAFHGFMRVHRAVWCYPAHSCELGTHNSFSGNEVNSIYRVFVHFSVWFHSITTVYTVDTLDTVDISPNQQKDKYSNK